jgi:formylglycine-generating enzyme required for sulfatase activity
MRLLWTLSLAVASMVAPLAILVGAIGHERARTAPAVGLPDLVELRPGAFAYRLSGGFTRDGAQVTAPRVTTVIRRLVIMRHEVTAADYRRCVDAGACAGSGREPAPADRPMVKVNWRDVHAYASWLSRASGMHFRLPTDEEWAYAAASRFSDDAIPDTAGEGDPGHRELADYDRETRRSQALDKRPEPIGSFGVNENGLLDLAGNVWEWTDTCFVRTALDRRGKRVAAMATCGIRVAEGRHRAYVIDFVRDARGGGCSAGAPPANLGFRLVRDDDGWPRLLRLLAAAWPEVWRGGATRAAHAL